jgi:hypothetical protein
MGEDGVLGSRSARRGARRGSRSASWKTTRLAHAIGAAQTRFGDDHEPKKRRKDETKAIGPKVHAVLGEAETLAVSTDLQGRCYCCCRLFST